ncbi:MAG: Gfo/Idh/MocA family oxidoreductase [Bacteroidetes bacterium]|nr:Gfo/Idh/MocA family oxidoreductase [Bacteroidota bacterium]
MGEPLRIGVLSTAKIARHYVIPAIRQSSHCRVEGIASRNSVRAKETASEFDIPRSYGSYEALLADSRIDAVYIPLPNHLHVEWSVKALEAGKHVLCEKPIGLNAGEARQLKAASDRFPSLKVMEAFMYRYHPRWKRVAEIVQAGGLGEIRAVHCYFSYYNTDPENYRNKSGMGGGALMDVGCYAVSVARLIFGREPETVTGASDIDPEFGIDRLTSGLMSFGSGSSVFTCSTQAHNDQYVNVYGTEGMIELDQPFNPDFSQETTFRMVNSAGTSIESFAPCNHFTLQADAFSECISSNTPPPLSLEDSIANMAVIDQLLS